MPFWGQEAGTRNWAFVSKTRSVPGLAGESPQDLETVLKRLVKNQKQMCSVIFRKVTLMFLKCCIVWAPKLSLWRAGSPSGSWSVCIPLCWLTTLHCTPVYQMELSLLPNCSYWLYLSWLLPLRPTGMCSDSFIQSRVWWPPQPFHIHPLHFYSQEPMLVGSVLTVVW